MFPPEPLDTLPLEVDAQKVYILLLYNSIHSTRFYVMWHQILYFLQNLLIPLLLFNKERSSSKRRMEGGIADSICILIKNRRREQGRDVKILSARMLGIKGSAEHSRWTMCR